MRTVFAAILLTAVTVHFVVLPLVNIARNHWHDQWSGHEDS